MRTAQYNALYAQRLSNVGAIVMQQPLTRSQYALLMHLVPPPYIEITECSRIIGLQEV
jgi:hypothetical protein